MAKGLVRHQKSEEFHFLTFSCYRRLPLLNSDTDYRAFEQELETVRLRYGFVVVGYVLMPEHVHLLVGETPGVPLCRPAGVEAANIKKVKEAGNGPLLAKALLRLQRMDRAEDR